MLAPALGATLVYAWFTPPILIADPVAGINPTVYSPVAYYLLASCLTSS